MNGEEPIPYYCKVPGELGKKRKERKNWKCKGGLNTRELEIERDRPVPDSELERIGLFVGRRSKIVEFPLC